MLVAAALAAISFRAHRAHADLIGEVGSTPGRDEPLTATEIVVEDVVGVKLEEPKPSEDVGGRSCAPAG